ncbi:MAG: hypothetical protein WCG27_02120 [Pseudomonadota bacterium]
MLRKKGPSTIKINIRKGTKVVSLHSWREKKKSENKDKHYREYLGVLGLNELINESNELIRELKHHQLNNELSGRSKLILQQFNRRLEPLGGKHASSLKILCKKIEKKILKALGTEAH